MGQRGRKNLKPGPYPLDEPVLDEPGISYAESDWQGNAKFGFEGLPAEHMTRARKGDLGYLIAPNHEPRSSFEAGADVAPWGNLKDGR
jgi:hypothetical protein